jgi:hypothetical protein
VTAPDPAGEIVMTTLHGTRGANYWSQRPVTRLDLRVGAYDEIPSSQVPGFTDALVRALPGLVEHHCSIGQRGGFLTRLRRGTYAPHIVEHVALELQSMIGHDVGYGRTRGGDAPGEYTVVIEHRHEQVGLRSAALALEVVQRAFAGTLEQVDAMVAELAALAETPDAPPLHQRVTCGITGGRARAETQEALLARLDDPDALVVDVAPAYVLRAGLPYARSEMAIVLDAELSDVPDRYREAERARRLVSVVADAVRRGGVVVCPAREWEVQDRARDLDCRVAVFSVEGEPRADDLQRASAFAVVRDGRLVVTRLGDEEDAGAVDGERPVTAQLAAALAAAVRDDGRAGASPRATTDTATVEARTTA